MKKNPIMLIAAMIWFFHATFFDSILSAIFFAAFLIASILCDILDAIRGEK